MTSRPLTTPPHVERGPHAAGGQPDAWDAAPAGLLVLRADATVVRANATFLGWVGRERADVEGRVRLPELLGAGGRIYWETHLAPLLHVDGRVDEIALELRGTAGRLPVLLTAVADPQTATVRVAVAVAQERRRYERELQDARTAAERSETQVRALQEVSAALSGAVGVSAVVQAVLAAAVGPLGAAAATLWLTDEDGLVAAGSIGEPVAPTPDPSRVGAGPDGRLVLRLAGQLAPRGVLSLRAPGGPGADALDLEVVTAAAQQAGLALDRAQAYEQSAGVAHALQQSLLAGAPPVDERYAVATVYRPGVEALEVGGDWYDVFLGEPGLLSVVVGDVVGRGLAAASAMGQLRSAVRAVAGPGTGPARLFARLDRFVEQVDAASMATVAYAELALATGEVTYACAGHPPPLLLPAAGPPTLLWEGRSTPLGAFVHPQPREQATVRLAPGDRLLLYTDGLVERRDRSLDDGLQLLARVAGGLGQLGLEDAVRLLTRLLLVDERGRDDVCVLLLEWSGGGFAQTLSADLSGLSAARRALRTWLTQQGVGERVDDLVLATSEVVANGAEHGAGLRPGEQVALRAAVERRPDGGEDVVVTVSDRGRWRDRQASQERGRGLAIVAALVDEVTVERGDGTTVRLRARVPGRPS